MPPIRALLRRRIPGSDFKVLAALMVIPLFALHYSARNALAISLAPYEKAAASSVTSAMGSISEALGNGLGGVIMGSLGMNAAMWIAAALSASAAPVLEVTCLRRSGGRGGEGNRVRQA